MRRRVVRRRLSILAATLLCSLGIGAGAAVTAATPAAASCASTITLASTPVRQGHILGIVPNVVRPSGAVCANATIIGGPSNASSKFKGTPPLVYNGGPVMGATLAHPGDVKVTPIYWDPTGSMFATTYKTVVNHYIRDIAADNTGLTDLPPYTNVYSVDLQLGIHYDIHNPGAKADADPFPADGCTPDSRPAYNDDSLFTVCLTDAQVQTELSSFLTANSITPTVGDLYLMMLPKGVEECTASGAGTGGDCSTPYAAGFCGYHSFFNGPNPPIYAVIPFPSYNSPGKFSCASTIVPQLNGNNDGDVVVSIVSHEVNEAITDPYASAWFDFPSGSEIGDECAWIYGTLTGTAPAEYNQTINGDHYLTQEEASNENYRVAKKKPCVQAVDLPTGTFKVKPKSPKANTSALFETHKTVGQSLSFTWNFGDGSPAVPGGSTINHTYVTPGTYSATLTMTDNVGFQHSSIVATVPVVVRTP